MYKYSFLDHRTRMSIAAPITASDLSATGHARRTRVAVAGATGYAGQELVRLLARHPAVTLTAAMSSGASSTPRPLPALARIWDDAVMPLEVAQSADEVAGFEGLSIRRLRSRSNGTCRTGPTMASSLICG